MLLLNLFRPPRDEKRSPDRRAVVRQNALAEAPLPYLKATVREAETPDLGLAAGSWLLAHFSATGAYKGRAGQDISWSPGGREPHNPRPFLGFTGRAEARRQRPAVLKNRVAAAQPRRRSGARASVPHSADKSSLLPPGRGQKRPQGVRSALIGAQVSRVRLRPLHPAKSGRRGPPRASPLSADPSPR